MTDVEIRAITPEEIEAFMRATTRAFHGRWDPGYVHRDGPLTEPDRSFVAVDDGSIVATAAACTTTLTVPGGSLAAPGITAVGVLPSHRRRGINSRLMGGLLEQAVEREEPLTYLWASETPIYGRYGFGLASWAIELSLAADRAAFAPQVGTSGRVRTLEKDEALALMRPVYDEAATARPGMIAIDERWWTSMWTDLEHDDETKFFAVHEDDAGRPDGYAVYTVKHEWAHSVPSNELSLRDLIGTNVQARASLWRYLFDIDLVSLVKAWDRPLDDEIRWILAEPRRAHLMVADGLWVRVLDVPAALEGRRYRSDGRLVLEVRDDFRPQTSGRYELVVEAGTGTCARTDAEGDLTCDIAAVGAAYLGGTTFHELARAGLAEAASPESLDRAGAMFGWDPHPWYGFIY